MTNLIELSALDIYRSTWQSIDEGGLTVADVVEAHKQLSARHDELEACVKKEYTVKQLKARLPHAWHAGVGGKYKVSCAFDNGFDPVNKCAGQVDDNIVVLPLKNVEHVLN